MYKSGFLVLLLVCSHASAVLRSDNAPFKGFSGIRVDPSSLQKVLFYDQTIAVIEMDRNSGSLINCELIEINQPHTGKILLQNLTQTVGTPTRLAFPEMNELMQKCQDLSTTVVADQPVGASSIPVSATGKNKRSGSQEPGSSSILSGILPGTRWCGTGDIAKTYYDLGSEAEMDKCCRTHDLCPVKVRAFQNRYGLQNQSFYTKSHCICDDMLQECLRKSKSPTADVMGNIYFNLLRVPCLEDAPATDGDGDSRARTTRRFRTPKRY